MRAIKIIVSKDGYSLIKTSVLLNDQWHEGYFIIDTGSSRSMVSVGASSISNGKEEIQGIDGKGSHGERSFTKLMICETCFPFPCLRIKRQQIPKVEYSAIGIIGTDFLLRNNLIIDYSKKSLYKGRKSFSISRQMDRYALCKMELGLKGYGIPVMASIIEGQCFFLIADTGSVVNVISKDIERSLKLSDSIPCALSIVEGIGGTMTIAETKTALQIILLHNGKAINYAMKGIYGIKQNAGKIIRKETANYEIDGIIGNKILIQGKWILDYCNRIMYSTSIQC